LREGGRAAVELDQLSVDLAAARRRRQARLAGRARRSIFATREALARIEVRLQELAKERPRSTADAIDAFMNAGVPLAEEE
jgi:hypothetical protein